jgi:outer membrane biogenesis lipoprotein LolB
MQIGPLEFRTQVAQMTDYHAIQQITRRHTYREDQQQWTVQFDTYTTTINRTTNWGMSKC